MQIGKILYPIDSLGPGKRLGIWTLGCTRFCKGCANPELQVFDKSKDVSPEAIYDAVKDYVFDGITISGGEPFIQTNDLRRLIELFRNKGIEDILIFTGYKSS